MSDPNLPGRSWDSPSTVRRTVTITRYTVDVGDGTILVTFTPTSGGGYSAQAEVQYRPTGYTAYEASMEAIDTAVAYRNNS